MSKEQVEQYAFVLHSRPFKENQQLVELLTENEGKISALVYVGQSKRSIKKGMVQPFLPLKITYKDKHAALKKISNIESASKAFSLSKESLFSGFYLNELLVKLLKNDIECKDLFEQYQLALSSLSKDLPIAPQLRPFELCLLAELGLSFDFTPVYNEINEKIAGFYYVSEQGFVPAYKYSIESINTVWYKTSHLQAIAQHIQDDTVPINSEEQQTFKRLMRSVINELLDGKPLNSRKLFEKR